MMLPGLHALLQELAERVDATRLTSRIVEQAGKGERLDADTRAKMEQRLGGRFADVRIFRGPLADMVARAHRADAVTLANTGMILMRDGPRADVKTALGRALLAHELTHVAQAQRGLHFTREGGEPLTSAHEQEAAAVESAVLAEEIGSGAKARAARVDEQKVVARVLELVAEHQRCQRDRLGEE
jgi:hypothetical protein